MDFPGGVFYYDAKWDSLRSEFSIPPYQTDTYRLNQAIKNRVRSHIQERDIFREIMEYENKTYLIYILADRWNKKRIMLLADLAAACGTITVLVLYSFAALRIWHLYVINVLLSFMNAFQNPASFVATSLLVPSKHYTRDQSETGCA